MGSPIRSEIWACVAPVDPELAASLVWMDSSIYVKPGRSKNNSCFYLCSQR